MKQHLLEFFRQVPITDDIFIKGYESDALCEITCRQFRRQVFDTASFLKSRLVSKGDRVAVISEKCPDIISSFFGIWLNGAICVPVCETLKPVELAYILENSGTKIVLCSEALKTGIEKIASRLGVPVFDFASMRNASFNSRQNGVFTRSNNPDDTAFLIYTSGSTGDAKGVMLSHRNIALNAEVSRKHIGMAEGDSVMSILPYWHSFALTAEIFTMLGGGGGIFIPKNKASLIQDIRAFKPTIVLVVPRIAEVMKKGIEASVAKQSLLKQKLFSFARNKASNYHLAPNAFDRALQKPFYWLMKKLILGKVKNNFGGRLKYFVGGGAPLDASLQKFFLSIDIPIYQGYGLTESAPVISINSPHDFKIDTSGKMISWMGKGFFGDYTFEDDNGDRGKDLKGEILVKGACVMQGYWRMKEETDKVLQDGWLRTGDMGYVDEDGFLVISGRKKNMVCLRGGEKFYPEFVEEKLKSSPYITQAMIVGEGCTRVGVVVNVDREAAERFPKEDMDKILTGEIRSLTDEFSTHMRPVRHLILPEFTPEEGLLTNTLKIRRHEIFKKYGERIEELLNVTRKS